MPRLQVFIAVGNRSYKQGLYIFDTCFMIHDSG